MKILKEHSGLEIQCHDCTCIYLVEENDITCSQDILCAEINCGAPDFIATWKCPICQKSTGKWLYELPSIWRDGIKKSSGFSKDETCLNLNHSSISIYRHIIRQDYCLLRNKSEYSPYFKTQKEAIKYLEINPIIE